MEPKKIAPFFWIFFIFLIQNALNFIVPQKSPVLLLAAVLFYALSEGPRFGFFLGAYTGMLLEIFGVGRIGGEMLVFSLMGFIFGQSSVTFFRESFFSQLVLPVLAFYFTVLLRFLLLRISGGITGEFSLIRESFLSWEIVAVMAVSPAIFFFLKKISYSRR